MHRRLLGTLATILLAASFPGTAFPQDVVAVVSAKSPVTALHAGQVADIFLGKSSRYPDGSPAIPIDLSEDSPTRERFYTQFTGKSPAQMKAHWSKIIFTGRGQPPRQVSGSLDARKAIAENPSAIGYIDSAAVDASVRVLATR